MPYLRVTSPVIPAQQRRLIADRLTEEVVRLFTPPRGPSAADIRDRTTVHFTGYAEDEVFIGGRPTTEHSPDVTVELSDWSMSVRQQRRVAAALTPLLVDLFGADIDAVNIRFHSYPASDFAVGGQLLSHRVPGIARLAKRLS